MVDEVVAALRQAFGEGLEADIEERPGTRVTGAAVLSGFAGYDGVRQDMLRQALRGVLGADAQKVGVRLAYTSDEHRAMRAA